MEHLLRETPPVVQEGDQVLQQTGGKLQERSWIVEVGALLLLLLHVKEVVHLRPVLTAVTNHLVVGGDC